MRAASQKMITIHDNDNGWLTVAGRHSIASIIIKKKKTTTKKTTKKTKLEKKENHQVNTDARSYCC